MEFFLQRNNLKYINMRINISISFTLVKIINKYDQTLMKNVAWFVKFYYIPQNILRTRK